MQQLILGVIKNERTNMHLWLRLFRLVFSINLPAICFARAKVYIQLEKSSTYYLNVVSSCCAKLWAYR